MFRPTGPLTDEERQYYKDLVNEINETFIQNVADGRGMNGSLGYTLSELADKLISLGAEKAINLDGGGSSAIVGKDGKVLNRPSDTGDGVSIVMRQVPTALVITAE